MMYIPEPAVWRLLLHWVQFLKTPFDAVWEEEMFYGRGSLLSLLWHSELFVRYSSLSLKYKSNEKDVV